MADLSFEIRAEWAGSGVEGEGMITASDQTIRYSAPASMRGKGVGTSPEELLLAAVTACYSGTFFRVLQQAELPVESLAIRTEGVVQDYPKAARFGRITVIPTVIGGDPARQPQYRGAAARARDLCFIGKTVRDYLAYTVGEVVIQPVASR